MAAATVAGASVWSGASVVSASASPSSFSYTKTAAAASAASSQRAFLAGSPVAALRSRLSCRRSNAASKRQAACMAADIPTVADTKRAFLQNFSKPLPSIYNNVIQELLVQQHLVRQEFVCALLCTKPLYNVNYQYDPIFALGFVTVYDQLMDGYAKEEENQQIFEAYIKALKEDPKKYRSDAKSLEQWASSASAESLLSFANSNDGVPGVLSDIAARASQGKFHYSKLFAIGMFRLLELSNSVNPETLGQLTSALNVNKMSIDRDLDNYRGLLNKLKTAKELLKEFTMREKKKQAERAAEKTKAAQEKEAAPAE
eukprot:jgi/Chlat1/3059/Chrsp21S00240